MCWKNWWANPLNPWTKLVFTPYSPFSLRTDHGLFIMLWTELSLWSDDHLTLINIGVRQEIRKWRLSSLESQHSSLLPLLFTLKESFVWIHEWSNYVYYLNVICSLFGWTWNSRKLFATRMINPLTLCPRRHLKYRCQLMSGAFNSVK